MIYPTIKVLLVEDEPLQAAATKRIVLRNAEGRFAVTHESTLTEALEALSRDNFDAVLLDLNLPDSSGLKTLTTVTETAPEVSVIVLTATEHEDVGVRAVQLGAQDFLVKGSFNDDFLRRCILYSVERHRLQRTIRQLAIVDELTGLYNRRGFMSLLEEILDKVRAGNLRGYVLYFDLDRFKAINDAHGHKCGDEALIHFAVLLREVFRKDTLLVRMGGDEFLAMGVETRPGLVESTLGMLDGHLDELNMMPERKYDLLTSRGIHYFGAGDNMSADHLLAQADERLYENKRLRQSSAFCQVDEHGRASA